MPVVACKLVARTCALLFIQRFATNPLRWGANFTKTIKNMKNQDFSKRKFNNSVLNKNFLKIKATIEFYTQFPFFWAIFCYLNIFIRWFHFFHRPARDWCVETDHTDHIDQFIKSYNNKNVIFLDYFQCTNFGIPTC